MMHAILLMMMLFSFHLRVGLLQTRILYRLLTCDGLSCDFVIIKSCIFCVLYIRLFNNDELMMMMIFSFHLLVGLLY